VATIPAINGRGTAHTILRALAALQCRRTGIEADQKSADAPGDPWNAVSCGLKAVVCTKAIIKASFELLDTDTQADWAMIRR